MRKRKASVILALITVLALTGCGNNTAQTNSESSEATTLVTVPENKIKSFENTNDKPVIQPHIGEYIRLTTELSVKTEDVGNWETYATNLKLPDNTYVVVDTDNGNRLTAAHVDNTSAAEIVLNYEAVDDINQPIDYMSFSTSADFYVVMSDITGTEELQHYAKTDDTATEAVDLAQTFTGEVINNIVFDSYSGEETVDGVLCDVIHCKANDEEINDITDLYYTKDGHFYKLVTKSDKMTISVYEAGSITIPEKTWPDDEIEVAQATYSGVSYGFILAVYDPDKMNQTAAQTTDQEGE